MEKNKYSKNLNKYEQLYFLIEDYAKEYANLLEDKDNRTNENRCERYYKKVYDFIKKELDKAREEVERKFVEKYHKRGKEMNVPYSEEDGKEFWQGYKEGYNQGLKDMIVDTYYLDKEFELKLKQ